ncbi:MAG: acyl-protein synthetase [Rubrivivax sp.]|nr:acyl-protein synthetase [Rubrivivax sp.]
MTAVADHDIEAPPALDFDLTAPYGLAAPAKQQRLLAALNRLTEWHAARCEPYQNLVERLFDKGAAASREDLPYLPVRLFKTLELRSVPRAEVFKTLSSSGTTGQAVSRIFLDRETAARQTRVLAAIMASFLGRQRLPMVIVDSANLLQDRTRFNARAAGILGFSTFGRNHFHCLDDELVLDADALDAFLDKHRGAPVFAFGFTFVVWQSLYQGALRAGRRFDFGPGSTLVHGGGWKRLADQQVDGAEFGRRLRERLGIERVLNYYGMVEQVGSVFMECEHGHLHSPVFADVVIRDPQTLEALPAGRKGLIQVLSALPLSYPGHSILTEDLGILHGEDDCPCGRAGRYFSVLGRLPQAELRGCSDTRSM